MRSIKKYLQYSLSLRQRAIRLHVRQGLDRLLACVDEQFHLTYLKFTGDRIDYIQ